jgi:hypothetical protein
LVNKLKVGETPVLVVVTPSTIGLVAVALYADWTDPFDAVWPTLQNEADMAPLLDERNVTYALVDGNSPSSAKIAHLADKENLCPGATFGSVSVLKLKREYHHQQELLLNTAPWSGEHCSLAEGALFAG